MTTPKPGTRARILREEIARILAQPCKKTLTQAEALQVLAKCDGLRNHHIKDADAARQAPGQPQPGQTWTTTVTLAGTRRAIDRAVGDLEKTGYGQRRFSLSFGTQRDGTEDAHVLGATIERPNHETAVLGVEMAEGHHCLGLAGCLAAHSDEIKATARLHIPHPVRMTIEQGYGRDGLLFSRCDVADGAPSNRTAADGTRERAETRGAKAARGQGRKAAAAEGIATPAGARLERWAVSAAEIHKLHELKGSDELMATWTDTDSRGFDNGPTWQVVVTRNGTTQNRTWDGTRGVPGDVLEMIESEDALYHPHDDGAGFDETEIWLDVVVGPDGRFLRKATETDAALAQEAATPAGARADFVHHETVVARTAPADSDTEGRFDVMGSDGSFEVYSNHASMYVATGIPSLPTARRVAEEAADEYDRCRQRKLLDAMEAAGVPAYRFDQFMEACGWSADAMAATLAEPMPERVTLIGLGPRGEAWPQAFEQGCSARTWREMLLAVQDYDAAIADSKRRRGFADVVGVEVHGGTAYIAYSG